MKKAQPVEWRGLPGAPEQGCSVCALDAVADGGAKMFSFGAAEKPFRLLVLRSGDGVFGYVNSCAHFGVPLAEKPEQLIFNPHVSISCNVHYARYRWQDGYCESGDCEGESLLTVPLAVREGIVQIG